MLISESRATGENPKARNMLFGVDIECKSKIGILRHNDDVGIVNDQNSVQIFDDRPMTFVTNPHITGPKFLNAII